MSGERVVLGGPLLALERALMGAGLVFLTIWGVVRFHGEVGRQTELGVLEELAASENPELYVLFGRRRVGKTELLQQFCRRRRAVYFLGAEVREKDNLRAFRDALTDILAPDYGFAPTLRIADFEVKDWINLPDRTDRMRRLLSARLQPRA